MYEYFYSREVVNGLWNIDNPMRVDYYSNQIYLANEVETALPDRQFYSFYNVGDVKISFSEQLTEEENGILTLTVQKHKDNE